MKIALVLTLIASIFHFETAFADRIGNGGDAIEIGGAVKAFDVIEYQEPFIPASNGAVWSIIQRQLGFLEGKLPLTARYLRNFYLDGGTVWWLVNVKLKDIADEGHTNIIITYRKEQVAANHNGVIQIRKDLWMQMDDESKATLLIHEMLWSAVGASFIGDGSNIRELSRYLLHPGLEHFSPHNVMQFILLILGDSKSTLTHWVRYDQAQTSGTQNFLVREVTAGLSKDLLVTVTNKQSPLSGKQISGRNPNRAIGNIYCRGHNHDPIADGQTLAPKDLCTSLNYAGQSGWRLPTNSELDAMIDIGLGRLTYLNNPVYMNKSADYLNVSGTRRPYAVYLNDQGRMHCLKGQSKYDDCVYTFERRNSDDLLSGLAYLCVK